ncbi:uncharacterized protein EI90DRAFT_3017176 [Cantharellus anzutake]|uniref:uncharacterized protein n=1 Tax=Cantharellus anzutake TaxID=1750568 RepID=UPI0019065B17|nr:uncharacterized protein EI90DRAFT_3017176 [Cantharellus anzutake]KAF8329379.1 hypothetical protein EI90DRAFT_3017176 [Cantharellus anzutake]
MLGWLIAVFRALFGARSDHPTVSPMRDLASLATLADTPAVKGILRDAEARGDQAAQSDHSQKCDHRRKTANVSRPTLEGSPSTWGWKVDVAAQFTVICNGLNDAIHSTVFDPKEVNDGLQMVVQRPPHRWYFCSHRWDHYH